MVKDASSVFPLIRKSAEKLGNCDPQWLKTGIRPDIQVAIAPASGTEQEQLTKPEMILMHGLFGALSNWDATIPLFEKYSRPVAIEFPITTAHRSEVKVKSLAAMTEFYIRENELEPVTLCGNSLGGHVALRICLTNPELVDCLILSGTSGLYEHSVDALPIRPDRKFVKDHMHRVFHNPEFITDKAVDEIADILKSRVRTLNLIHAARSAKKDNLEKLLGQIKVPTLLLWGENDEVTTMDVAQQFNRLIPNSELVSIKNCGHAPMIEYPEWFSENVDRFLRKHSRYYKNS
jgi:pimeloyl-ACP methyl ester carboxylesterase